VYAEDRVNIRACRAVFGERRTAALAKANLLPVQRALPGGNESLNSVAGLPAPFGPRKPVTTPGSTTKLSPSTAVLSPYRLVRPSISITIDPSLDVLGSWT